MAAVAIVQRRSSDLFRASPQGAARTHPRIFAWENRTRGREGAPILEKGGVQPGHEREGRKGT